MIDPNLLKRAIKVARQDGHFKQSKGPTWMAMWSMEVYGMHFSVSSPGRKPTDEEIAQAREQMPETAVCDTEVRHSAPVNPFVRHFIAGDKVAQTPFNAVFRRV